MKECDKRTSHISSKLHMIYVCYNNGRHPVTKTFTPPTKSSRGKKWRRIGKNWPGNIAQMRLTYPSRVNRFSILRTDLTSSEAHQRVERAFSPRINLIRRGHTFPLTLPVFFACCLIKNLSLQQTHFSLFCNENCSYVFSLFWGLKYESDIHKILYCVAFSKNSEWVVFITRSFYPNFWLQAHSTVQDSFFLSVT